MSTAHLFRDHGPTISFGFLLALLSSFGQTFFIALSVPGIQRDFGLSHGAVGMLFSIATLTSGLAMIYVGAALDRVSVRFYALFSLCGLAVSALAMSFVAGILGLTFVLLALRLFGQGMLSHAAVTSVARLPQAVRGRSLGFATLGFQVGAGLIPAAGIALITLLGWEMAWRVVAGVLALALLIMFALRPREPALPVRDDRDQAAGRLPSRQPPRQRRRDVLRDTRFWILFPAMLAAPAISTGYFFHQRYIAEIRGWGVELLGAGMTAFAIASVIGAMAAGFLADRIGSVRVSRFFLLPLALSGLLLIGAGGSGAAGTLTALAFFAMVGLTGGASQVTVTGALADLYGTAQIGMIRAMAAAIMVVASALTPGLFGIAVDMGISFGMIGLAGAAYCFAASGLAIFLPARPMH
jgi:predicted MFS family arabinose efflux permease